MRLIEAARDLSSLADKLDEFRMEQESLSFCLDVYLRYNSAMSDREPANEFMDADKAKSQLLDSIKRMVAL